MVSPQLISRLSLSLHHFFTGRYLCLRAASFQSQPSPLQDSTSLWLTWKGQGGVCVRHWAGNQMQLQLWFAQLHL